MDITEESNTQSKKILPTDEMNAIEEESSKNETAYSLFYHHASDSNVNSQKSLKNSINANNYTSNQPPKPEKPF